MTKITNNTALTNIFELYLTFIFELFLSIIRKIYFF